MRTIRVLAMATGLLLLGSVVEAQAPKAPDMDRHTMESQVTKVDPKEGWIDVKTSAGSMKLHFPPEALASVKKGDSVSVELGIKDNGPAPSGTIK